MNLWDYTDHSNPAGSFPAVTFEPENLIASNCNVHLSALRRLAAEAADNGLLDPDIAAGIAKVKGAHRSILIL